MPGPRIPFHRHLEWLCLEELPEEDIKKYYDNIQFMEPVKSHFQSCDDLAQTLPISSGMRRRLGKKVFSEDDYKLWDKLGYGEVYLHRFDKKDWSEIGRILNHPVMRVALECCIIAKVPDNELVQLLPSVYSLPLSEASLETYKKYFFDIEPMQKKDWQAYLDLLSTDRYTYTRLFAALTKPRDEVMHLVGLPTRIQFGTMLKNVMHTSVFKFDYYSRQSSPEAQAEARNWAKLMIAAGEKHEKFGVNDATDFSTLIQTEFVYIDTPLETISSDMISEVKPQLSESDKTGPAVPVPTQDKV